MKKVPVVMITLRVPEWLHDAIEIAAHDSRTSMNQFCINNLRAVLPLTSKEVGDATREHAGASGRSEKRS